MRGARAGDNTPLRSVPTQNDGSGELPEPIAGVQLFPGGRARQKNKTINFRCLSRPEMCKNPASWGLRSPQEYSPHPPPRSPSKASGRLSLSLSLSIFPRILCALRTPLRRGSAQVCFLSGVADFSPVVIGAFSWQRSGCDAWAAAVFIRKRKFCFVSGYFLPLLTPPVMAKMFPNRIQHRVCRCHTRSFAQTVLRYCHVPA